MCKGCCNDLGLRLMQLLFITLFAIRSVLSLYNCMPQRTVSHRQHGSRYRELLYIPEFEGRPMFKDDINE